LIASVAASQVEVFRRYKLPHQDVPNTVRVEVAYAYDNNNMENVWHVRTSDVPTDADLVSILANMQTWLETDWAPLASPQVSALSITATSLHDLTGPRMTVGINPAIVGTSDSAALPANVTIAIKANIGTRGRGKSGRTFWVGLGESQVVNNELLPTPAAAIVAALNQLNALMADIGEFLEGLVIPHFVVGGVRPPSVGTSAVIGYSMANFVTDSQRDRLPGHKRARRRTTPTP
jgi:hypothetical protein